MNQSPTWFVRASASVLVAMACLVGLTIGAWSHPEPMPGDLSVVRAVQRLGQPVPAIADLVRLVTSTEACIVAALPAVVWIATRRRRALLPVVLIALTSMLVVQPVSKELIDRPRPSGELVDVRADYSSKSYPSGHSLSTTTTWGAASACLWRSGRRRMATAAGAPVVLTAFASSVQGVHWPSDAIAGTLIGALAAWLIVRALAPTTSCDARSGDEHAPPAPGKLE